MEIRQYLLVVYHHISMLRAKGKSNNDPFHSPLLLGLFLAAAAALLGCPASLRLELLESSLSDLFCSASGSLVMSQVAEVLPVQVLRHPSWKGVGCGWGDGSRLLRSRDGL